MITSIRQVHENFFKLFYNVTIKVKGEEKTVHSRYARKSSNDYAEEDPYQIYPCIAIQDYAPTVKDDWYIDKHQYFGGVSKDGLSGYLFHRPVWMDFHYDVSIAALSYNDYVAMQDYFAENFVDNLKFIFNSKLDGNRMVGDIVSYKVVPTDISRSDGVYETNYDFNLYPWVQLQKPKEVELVQDIIIRAQPRST